jgi:transposase
MFDIKPKTLYHWYRNHLSNYKPDIEQGKWQKDTIPRKVDEQTGEILSESPVYIAKPENMGAAMVLDDKQIGKDVFSIMTNRETGKIALLVETLKVNELQMATEFLGDSIEKVRSISCDMSPSYLSFIQSTFAKSQIVIDKFHVIRYVIDALQNVRLEIKNQLLESLPRSKRKTATDQKVLSELELLKRSKYLLTQSQDKWTDYQTEIAEQVFEKFPKLKTAYQISEDFKRWYSSKRANKSRIVIEQDLYQWYENIRISEIKQFNSVVKMIERHEENIINYFSSFQTNAKAENLNGKIQRFISNNYGIKDKDFNLYRLSLYFS